MGILALAINERFLLGKSKKWVGCSMYLMTTLVENDNWEEIVGRCHAHKGTEFFIGSCIPSKYMSQGKPLGSSFHQKSLSYWLNYFPYYPLGIPRAWIMGYKENTCFAGFWMAFFAENLNIHLGFPICQPRSSSQSFKRTH